jgi:hypothetical protein
MKALPWIMGGHTTGGPTPSSSTPMMETNCRVVAGDGGSMTNQASTLPGDHRGENYCKNKSILLNLNITVTSFSVFTINATNACYVGFAGVALEGRCCGCCLKSKNRRTGGVEANIA